MRANEIFHVRISEICVHSLISFYLLIIKMETLFDTKYVNNTQPLRKYEPLIRFDIDGNQQPPRLLSADQIVLDVARPKSENADVAPKQGPTSKSLEAEPAEDLKRKVSPTSSNSGQPKKKQQKQASIMSFFNKKS